jgi:hypothetical protein
MLPQWLTKPEVIFSAGLGLVFFIASLYSAEIRRSFKLPRKKMVQSLLKFSENELQTIEFMHENAYYLLLWLARSVFDILNTLFWIMLAAIGVNMMAYFTVGHLLWTSWIVAFFGPMIGAILGQGRRNYGTIKALYDYANTVARLKRTIELCKAELQVSASQPHDHPYSPSSSQLRASPTASPTNHHLTSNQGVRALFHRRAEPARK